MIILPKDDPAALRAVAELSELVGYDIAAVFDADHWTVAEIDGDAQVLINRGGMRAMATFAPRPDAGEFVEDIIRQVDDLRRQRPDGAA